MEKQILGLYVSGHPLDDYRKVLQGIALFSPCKRKYNFFDFLLATSCREATCTTGSVLDQQRIIVGGMINSFKINTTKKGDTMATCRFEIAVFCQH